ncbi:hypothetical protein ACFC1R_21150 [Kitasatospora sp. NPDC056138]|uniref:hypothetical protein n=1 Tax=Kitasatospora sp. NPDC056138 TaxID=3345724 RepID=UPI0035E29AB2
MKGAGPSAWHRGSGRPAADAGQHRTHRRIDCEDGPAGPGRENVRITSIGAGGITEIRHSPQRPTCTTGRILSEAGAEGLKEQDAWAKDAFPAAHQRLQWTPQPPSRPTTR